MHKYYFDPQLFFPCALVSCILPQSEKHLVGTLHLERPARKTQFLQRNISVGFEKSSLKVFVLTKPADIGKRSFETLRPIYFYGTLMREERAEKVSYLLANWGSLL